MNRTYHHAPETNGRSGAKNAPALSETVGAFCKDMLRMRRELMRAKEELKALKQELAQRPAQFPTVATPDLRSLRRQIAFHCHPDRGGDTKLMQRVNELFDCLELASADQDKAA